MKQWGGDEGEVYIWGVSRPGPDGRPSSQPAELRLGRPVYEEACYLVRLSNQRETATPEERFCHSGPRPTYDSSQYPAEREYIIETPRCRRCKCRRIRPRHPEGVAHPVDEEGQYAAAVKKFRTR